MAADQDEADVERVLGGDVSAFEAIVRRWRGPLVNLVYRFFRDRGRAEEMAQEAFPRAYRSLSQSPCLARANFRVMRRTHGALLKELHVDPHVRAEQMGHAIDVTRTFTPSRHSSAVKKL